MPDADPRDQELPAAGGTRGIKCGVYEIAIGVADLTAATALWKAFGYTQSVSGRLSAADARSLYGVDSALTSVRLQHNTALDGLVRLMHWQRGTGDGLGLAPLKAVGSRWSVHRCADVLEVLAHAALWQRQGHHARIAGPLLTVANGQAFAAPVRSRYDLKVLLPEARLVMTEHHHMPHGAVGTIAEDAMLKVSEACRLNMVVRGEPARIAEFYAGVLGFRRGRHAAMRYTPDDPASELLDLSEGDAFTAMDFEHPESGPDTLQPGRLRVFVREGVPSPLAPGPGQLGYSFYTARVGNLSVVQARVQDAGASCVTPMQADEFGTAAFSLIAPDGAHWTLLQN